MKLTRRQAVVGAVAGVVGAGGIYELVDQLAGGTPTRADATSPFREQHLLDGIRVVQSNGIEAQFETPRARTDFGPSYYQVMFVDPEGLAVEVFCG